MKEWIAPALVALAAFAFAPSAAEAARAVTLAGSGAAGIADGSEGSFLMPAGVAWDGHGRLYVTDRSAQRVRVVDADGTIRTIAGSGELAPTGVWVAAGYADGPGASARFDTPTGIAIGADGSAYVADTGNHCIRKISTSDVVATVAGSPTRVGHADGTRDVASFDRPNGVAVDAKGTLYVSDAADGVRVVAPDGTVSTLDVKIEKPSGLALWNGTREILFVASVAGLWRIDLSLLASDRTAAVAMLPADRHGDTVTGYPFAVAAFDADSVAYSDPETHTVRFANVRTGDARVLGGLAVEDAARRSGAFADGTNATRFDAPEGVAVRADGAVAVADSGNKRIRLIDGIDRSEPPSETSALPFARPADPREYRIAFVGDDFVWHAGPFADSVAGRVQAQLDAGDEFERRGKRARIGVVRIDPTMAALRAMLSTLTRHHGADAVVVVLDDRFLQSYGVPDTYAALTAPGNAWPRKLEHDLETVRDSLARARIACLFVAHPLGTETALDEMPLASLYASGGGGDFVPDGAIERRVIGAFDAAKVDSIDAWSLFALDERSPSHRPLFFPTEERFTPYATSLLGDAIARSLAGGDAPLAVATATPATSVAAATVTTYAGSGRAAFADGAHGSFIFPAGLASRPNGDLVVADAGAQRIREIEAGGTIRTLAGSGAPVAAGAWVPGGYRDGAVTVARFDRPTGVAVAPNGDVVVADTGNHCIRAITPGGIVSTLAGDPNRRGHDDGSARVATFDRPAGVAVDDAGSIYVADPSSNGIRTIDAHGTVGTLALPIDAPTAVAVWSGGDLVLFVANAEGLWRVDLSVLAKRGAADATARMPSGAAHPTASTATGFTDLPRPGQLSAGFPFAVAALGPTTAVYTDVVTHTVRYADLSLGEPRLLGGTLRDDAPAEGGGYEDGTSSSRFDTPAGIAVRADGTVAVADSGSKRIRLIAHSDTSSSFRATDGLLPDRSNATAYRIALVGNSMTWGDGTYRTAVAGTIAHKLVADDALATAHRELQVDNVWLGSESMSALESYLQQLAATKLVDMVVVQLNDVFLTSYGVRQLRDELPTRAAWQPKMTADLQRIATEMKTAGIPVLFVVHPLGTGMTFDEMTAGKSFYIAPDDQFVPDGSLEAAMTAPFRTAGVAWLDAWTPFYADEKSAQHQVQFLSVDGHFTPYGKALLGTAIAERLERDSPWKELTAPLAAPPSKPSS